PHRRVAAGGGGPRGPGAGREGPLTAAADWGAPVARGPVTGSARMPGSKSLTNRHLVLGLLAAEATVVHHPLVSRDTTLMLTAVQRLGAQVREEGSSWRLVAPSRPRGDVAVDCGLAGTVFRFLPPVAALAQGA